MAKSVIHMRHSSFQNMQFQYMLLFNWEGKEEILEINWEGKEEVLEINWEGKEEILEMF